MRWIKIKIKKNNFAHDACEWFSKAKELFITLEYAMQSIENN